MHSCLLLLLLLLLLPRVATQTPSLRGQAPSSAATLPIGIVDLPLSGVTANGTTERPWTPDSKPVSGVESRGPPVSWTPAPGDLNNVMAGGV
jgi:hypothetical protein